MSKVIEKKATADYFAEVLSGNKTFDMRLADWDCQEGDTLVLQEIDASGQLTGRTLSKKVGFVLKTKDFDLFSKAAVEAHGYQVISLLEEEVA
jgi:hypothetical protein